MAYRINLFDYCLDDVNYCIGQGNLSQQSIQWEIQYAGGQDLEVHISSVGGSLFDAIAIYDMLKKYPGKVTTYIDAIAASAASVIAMAGDTVIMGKYALLMVHKPSTAAYGTADDMEATAQKLNLAQERLAAIYIDKTGLDEQAINDLINVETWLSAQQALDLGFVDSIEDYSAEITNHSAMKIYAKSAPAAYQQVFNKLQIKTPQTQTEMKTDTAVIEKNTSVLEKILNFFNKSKIVTLTDKGKLVSFQPLNIGVSVTNEAGDDVSDDDYTMTNKDGKKITAKVKDGAVANMVEEGDGADGEPDEDVDDKAIVNASGLKITNKGDIKGIAEFIRNSADKINQQNALIAELTGQLSESNKLVSRDEETIKNEIKSTFTPNGSKRSDTTEVNNSDAMPKFLQKVIEENKMLNSAVKIAEQKGRTPKQ